MDTSTIIIIIAVILIVMFVSGRMRGGRGGAGNIGDTPAFPGTRGPDRRDPPPGSGGDSGNRLGDAVEDAGRSVKDAVGDNDQPRRARDDSVVDDIERDRGAPEKKRL